MRTLDSPDAAVLYKYPRVLALLEVFMARPATLSAVAGQAHIPLASAHRMVERLISIGALEVAGMIERGGRAMKLYQVTAPAFFVPSTIERECLPDEVVRRTLDSHLDEQVPGLMKAAREALGDSAASEWGMVVYADRHGHLVARPDFKQGRTPRLLDDNSPAYLNFYLDDLRLNVCDAKRLQRELVDLLKRYKCVEPGSGTYTLSVIMAPMVARRR
ncbi:helix-turn-helix domain-containing protein [Ramlibacter tataouinensis]|uniref:Transcriptional regulator, IclR family-like protein n=1 Tax=Ramlibacter tataouinensis (strain ATCC BAA-407 / DSM 14655 / LMG 21543 / TTB310) TaxID=365046 RepID=F5XVJ6_RAMTT|nr:helix-turn-helix domain-containing protein [Ramlibacter tataouinensis]AEG91572.1 transcriptional regulator, IclR family-like protein [Ramlibacter tataouinensis TTB310]